MNSFFLKKKHKLDTHQNYSLPPNKTNQTKSEDELTAVPWFPHAPSKDIPISIMFSHIRKKEKKTLPRANRFQNRIVSIDVNTGTKKKN